MIKEGEVLPEGCIYEPSSDITPKWRDIRSKFGYTTLSEILSPTLNFKILKFNLIL